MTSVRNGIRTTLRAKGRTGLFALLILILTLALTLGVGMWVYSAQLLAQFDENYTSIVLAEYMGEDYPNANAADEQARAAFAALDDAAINAVDGVTLWERTDSTLAFPAGYHRSSGNIPYSDYGVIVVSGLSAMDSGYTGRISQALYTRKDKTGIFCIFEPGSTDFSFTSGYDKMYLLHGRFVDRGSNRTFVVTDFYEGCATKPWLELSGADDPALTDSLFARRAAYYRIANNAALVTASDDIAALEPFQQGTLYLQDGRFPTKGESGVCVLSGSTAELMRVGVGDTIDLSMLASDAEERYDLTETDDNRVWEVVGVTNVQSDYQGAFWVSKGEGGFSEPLFGFELGRAVLNNHSAVQAVATLEALMPTGVRLTLYDQGYSAAAQPIEALRTTAIAVTVTAVCAALAVLFLFAYLFVGRQQETVQVMLSLGTPTGKIRLWLLSGAALIAFAASAVGTVLGHLSLTGVITFALFLAQKLYAVDTRYSNAALGVIRETPEANGVSFLYSVAAGAAVFLAALLLCLLFVHWARHKNTPKKGKTSVRPPKGGTSLFGRGALRFALLSAKRGGWRSGIVPAATLVLTLLIGMLAISSSGWKDQIHDLYENGQLEGQVVSINGRNATNLDISASAARQLWKSGLLSDISVSLSWNYWTNGEMPNFGGSSFGQEARDGWISRQPTLTAANSLAAIPEFYYTDRPEIQWLDGWDESFLADTEIRSIRDILDFPYIMDDDAIPTYPVLASKAFLDANGLQLGDETEITVSIEIMSAYSTARYEPQIPIRIVGAFQQTGQKANLYVPLGFWCNPDWITGETDIMAEGEMLPNGFIAAGYWEKVHYNYTIFRACRFTLASAENLEAFKTFLADKSYSQVGKVNRNRITVLLLDQEFSETLGGLRRYITFGNILFPTLFLAVALIGFIISWLMINGRRMEFAILRGLGATRRRVFATFFLEQGALCIPGCLIGALLLTAFRPVPAIWLATVGFIGCYLAGCALSIRTVGRVKLMELLSERE